MIQTKTLKGMVLICWFDKLVNIQESSVHTAADTCTLLIYESTCLSKRSVQMFIRRLQLIYQAIDAEATKENYKSSNQLVNVVDKLKIFKRGLSVTLQKSGWS
ncbi:hypothetical protein RF11_07607 [Thelohanellus kitauei]|uniref:Uncharacterized protein n=1 Tax=Thelohanellus kitauei TaxID=669202 RepID=A0A0C2MC83_THEKT|nr:hypothetical protein RF11_07607 [Thelohanellus kitauei]